MMPPASMRVNTAVDTTGNEELRKPRASEIDFRISESTKKRIIAKTQAAGAVPTSDRKSTVDAALGKFLDDDSDNGGNDDCGSKLVSSKVGNSTPPPAASTNSVRKRPSIIRRVKDDNIGTSEHSSALRRRSRSKDLGHRSSEGPTSTRDPLSTSERSRQRSLSKSEHNPNRRKDASTRVSRTGDNSGKLGSMLDQISNGKARKKGPRSVVSMPAEIRSDSQSSGSEMTSGEHSGRRERIRNDGLGEEDLKSEGGSGASVASTNARGRDLRSGRKKTERELAVSPGPLIKKRGESPGSLKKRAASPIQVTKRSESLGPVKKRSEYEGLHKNRAASPGSLKKRTESPSAAKKRSESPGPMKKRSQSPGVVSKRKSTNESTQRMRSERVSRPGDANGTLGNMLDQVSGGKPKKKGARSVASAPVQIAEQAERRPSVGLPQKERSVRREPPREGRAGPPPRTRSVDAVGILSVTKEMGENDSRAIESRKIGTEERHRESDNRNARNPASESFQAEDVDNEPDTASTSPPPETAGRSFMARIRRSFSAGAGTQTPPNPPSNENNRHDIRNEIAKQRVKRNNSVGPGPRNDPARGDSEGNENQMKRAQSMLLHREMTRRAKSNSLADLVQYKEEEIHSTSYFASNHVLINRERMKRGLRPLTRNIAMDEQARKSAEAMANSNGLNPLQTTYVGNVLRGESIRSIHRSTMQQKQGRERKNLLNPYFQDFGVGTAKGEDGMLYMCQLFSERLELALTDTTSS